MRFVNEKIRKNTCKSGFLDIFPVLPEVELAKSAFYYFRLASAPQILYTETYFF